MAGPISGVNHVASMARDMDETVAYYRDVLGIGIKRIASDRPAHRHYVFDLGGDNTLDFFEAPPGTADADRSDIGGLHHVALTCEPAFIDEVEVRLRARGLDVRPDDRNGQKTIYFTDPNGIHLQLNPATGGTRAGAQGAQA